MSQDRKNWMPFSGFVSKGKVLKRFLQSCAFCQKHIVAYNIVAEGDRYGLCDWFSAPPKL